jgi:hypothetical protein
MNDMEDRLLRFEARKLAIESYVSIQTDRMNGARQLLVSQLRLLFTLSLGTVAAAATFSGALPQILGTKAALKPEPWLIFSIVVALLCLIGAAFIAANAIRTAASNSSRNLVNPLPKSGLRIEEVLRNDSSSESDIFGCILDSLDEFALQEKFSERSFFASIILMAIGLLLLFGSMSVTAARIAI